MIFATATMNNPGAHAEIQRKMRATASATNRVSSNRCKKHTSHTTSLSTRKEATAGDADGNARRLLLHLHCELGRTQRS